MNNINFFQEKFYGRMNAALVSEKDQSWDDCIARLYKEEVEKTGRAFIHDEYVDALIRQFDQWIDSEYASCLITGGIGIGKTALMKAVMRLFDALRVPITIPPLRCRSIAYYDATELCGRYVSSEEVRYEVNNCKVLFIDDAGYEADQYLWYGNVMSPIHDILLYRYSSRLPTIVATNLDLNGFAKKYGKRISDRVNELYAIIRCPERQSYRRMTFHVKQENRATENATL